MGVFDKVFGGGSSSQSSFVDPKQQPFLDFVRNLSQDVTQQNSGAAQLFSRSQGADLFNFGRQSLSQLSNNPFLDALQQQAGGNQALVDRQIGQLGGDLGRFFNQQLLPGLRRDSAAVGALGGSRQAVNEGLAAQSILDAFQRGATDIYTQDADRALRAGVGGGGLLGQGLLGGIAGASDLFGGVGLGQFTGGFAPASVFNSIIGAPTVLGQQKSSETNGIIPAFGSVVGG